MDTKKLFVEIELTIEEIDFFRIFFDWNQHPNVILFNLSKSGKKEYFDELQEKGLILIDQMSNCKLTTVGKQILEQISRDNLIDKLL